MFKNPLFVLGLNEVDYSQYPERALQLEWLRSYLEAYKEHKGQREAVTDTEVEVLYVQVNKFALVRIYFWSYRPDIFLGALRFTQQFTLWNRSFI